MMLEAEKQALRLGVEVVDLEVFAANTRAIHTYEKVGYKVTGRIPDASSTGASTSTPSSWRRT